MTKYLVSVLSGNDLQQKVVVIDSADKAIFLAAQMLEEINPDSIVCGLIRPNSSEYNEKKLIELHKFHFSFAWGWNE